VNPFALELLERKGIPTANFRSKSWNEFAAPGAPVMDLIITVCDNAAGEVCPVWPGEPITAHWGVPDPAAVEGDDAAKRSAFVQAYTVLARRIDILLGLRLEALDRLAAERRIRQIPSEA
jgi:arsenate reductase